MYFNIDWENDKSPGLTAANLNWLQTQYEELVKQIKEQKKDKTKPLGIRVDIDPDEAKVGEIFYLTGEDTQAQLSRTLGKTFYAFLQDPAGKLRYRMDNVEWRFKMVDKETACYLMQVGTEQEDDAGHGTPPSVSDNPYNPADKEYTIYYYTNGGTNIENQVVAGGSVITAPAGETTKKGYDFDGWYLDTDYTKPISFPFEVYGNVELYAKWVESEKIYYTVHFITNGGDIIEDVEVEAGTYYYAPEPAREGYNFTGWFLDASLSGEMIIFPYQINEDTTFYAAWEDATVYKTITYIYGVEDYSTVKVPVNSYIDLETPTKDGYDFNGWYKENTYQNKVESPILVEDNMILYAKWTEAIQYCTITYICPACQIIGASPTQIEKGKELTNVSYGVEMGYTAEGIYLDADYTQPVEFPMIVEEDLIIYIRAEKLVYYTVTYITDGTACESVTVLKGTQIGLATSEKEGYLFSGWQTADGEQVVSPYTVNSDITLYAVFEEIPTYTYMSEMPVRYVRSSCGANNMNSPRWQYIKVYSGGKNIAPGKTVTANFDYEQTDGTTSDINRVVTEDTNMFYSPSTVYYAAVTIDLGAKYNIDKIIINQNNNSYHSYQNNVIDISPDGVNWYVVSSSVFATSEDGWGERTRDLTTRLFRNVNQALSLVENAWALTPIRYIKYVLTGTNYSMNPYIKSIHACDWYLVPITPVSCVNLTNPDFDTTPITDNNSSTKTETALNQEILIDLGKEYNLGKIGFDNGYIGKGTIDVSVDNVNFERLYSYADKKSQAINLLTYAKS